MAVRARLLAAAAAIGAFAAGCHTLGTPTATPVVVAQDGPATPSPGPTGAAGVPLATRPATAAPSLPAGVAGVMDGLNRDTAAYVSGEITMLEELEHALAAQLTRLIGHLGLG